MSSSVPWWERPIADFSHYVLRPEGAVPRILTATNDRHTTLTWMAN